MTIVNYDYEKTASYVVLDISGEINMLTGLGLCQTVIAPQSVLGLLFLYKTEILVDSVIGAIKKQIENRGLDVDAFVNELNLLAINLPSIAKNIEDRHTFNYGPSIRLERFTTIKIINPDKLILMYDPDGEYKDAFISV